MGGAPFAVLRCEMRMEPVDPTQVASEHYSVTKGFPSVIDWFPPASIANTSNLYSVFDSRNCDGTVTLVTVGSLTSNMRVAAPSWSLSARSTMTW